MLSWSWTSFQPESTYYEAQYGPFPDFSDANPDEWKDYKHEIEAADHQQASKFWKGYVIKPTALEVLNIGAGGGRYRFRQDNGWKKESLAF